MSCDHHFLTFCVFFPKLMNKQNTHTLLAMQLSHQATEFSVVADVEVYTCLELLWNKRRTVTDQVAWEIRYVIHGPTRPCRALFFESLDSLWCSSTQPLAAAIKTLLLYTTHHVDIRLRGRVCGVFRRVRPGASRSPACRMPRMPSTRSRCVRFFVCSISLSFYIHFVKKSILPC
jgi:hypothetical protein